MKGSAVPCSLDLTKYRISYSSFETVVVTITPHRAHSSVNAHEENASDIEKKNDRSYTHVYFVSFESIIYSQHCSVF